MLPKTFFHLAALGLITYLPGTALLLGFPLFFTIASPAQIALIDFGSTLLADDGESAISRATQSTVQMDDNTSPLTSTLVSLWQSNLSALRVERFINWKATSASSVVIMATSY